MRAFEIRIERLDGSYYDTLQAGEDLTEAKRKFQHERPIYAPFDWRGQVVFVQGAKPAEDH